MSRYDEEPPSSGGLYLKLKDGEKVKIRLMTEPSRILKIFDDQREPEGRHKQVWVWGALVRTDGKMDPVIFEGSVSIFTQIRDLVGNEDWGDPVGYDIWVKRTGSGMDTKYSIAPGLRSAITDEMKAAYEKGEIKLPEHGSTSDYRKVKPQDGDKEYDPFTDE